MSVRIPPARDNSSVRFFLGVRETSGYLSRLGDGLRQIGVRTTTVDLSGHPFKYANPGWWVPASRLLAARRNRSSGLARGWWRFLQWVLTAAVLAWAAPRHDAFVLTSVPPLAARLTTLALRMLRKRVIILLVGSDARPPYLDGFLSVSREGSTDRLVTATRRQRRAVRALERWADVVVSHTATGHYLTRPFVPFLEIGIPAPADRGTRDRSVQDAVRIVHAPSDAIGKGSQVIRSAIAELGDEGLAIDYVELTGVPHERVLDELAAADLVVDQVYSDQPMPGLGTEAARVGSPVIIGGYDWEALRTESRDDAWPPTVHVKPSQIKDAIRRLATDVDARRAAGRAQQDFVESRWMPDQVARRYLRLAMGDVPKEWLFQPEDIKSVHGYGLTRERSAELVGAVIERAGRAGLGLADKPALEDRIARRALERTSVGGS